jgi:hypothetical protein
MRRVLGFGALAGCVLAALLTPGVSARPAVKPSAPLTFDSRVSTSDGKGEPEVAVDVTNPDILVNAYSSGIAVSNDGGHTWHTVAPDGADPVVVADSSGNFFASHLGSDGWGVSESTDHGATWTRVGGPLHNPLVVGPSVPDMSVHPTDGPVYMGPSAIGCDRPLMGADANTGDLYATCADHGDESGGEPGMTWEASFISCRANVFASEGFGYCGRRYVSGSHDHGVTWSPWEPQDSADYPAGYTGAFDGIPVAAHGVLATAYVAGAAAGSDCSQCAVFETSTDEGSTWSRHLIPGASPQIKVFSAGDPASFAGSDNQTVWLEPYVAADPSTPGRYAVMILDASRTQLLVYETTDSGLTWSSPAVLGSEGVHRRDKPAMAYGPTGALGVMWKDVNDSDLSFNVWAAVAPMGDLRFGPPVKLNSNTSPEETCGLGGSEGQAYACDELSWMVMDADHLDATWGDNRGGENPWFGRYAFTNDPQLAAITSSHRRP